MNFLELTLTIDNAKILVCIENVKAIIETPEGTLIDFEGPDGYLVKETITEIKPVLNEICNKTNANGNNSVYNITCNDSNIKKANNFAELDKCVLINESAKNLS